MSNSSSGNTVKIMDFPYLVGDATKVSFPETNVHKASSNLGFNGFNSICQQISVTASLNQLNVPF